jgi:hypothetical protein
LLLAARLDSAANNSPGKPQNVMFGDFARG